MGKRLKHDQLTKKILRDPIAAQELLEYYLPTELKEMVDLSRITIEPESYIEESLKNRYSDIVYGVVTKTNEKAFIYILLESKSSVDYWIALQLWKYNVLLCERHKNGQDKLPLIYNLVIYNGKEVYNAPRNLWDLFINPVMAKQFLTEDYPLVDLQSMPDDEIIHKQHLGMMEYMMKHIHQRDMIKLWDRFLEMFKFVIAADKEKGFIYIRYFLYYTDAKIHQEKQAELVQVLNKYLSEEEKDKIMGTIAQKYIEEGKNMGIQIGKNEGIQIGKNEGIQIGKNEGIQIGKNEGIQIGETRGEAKLVKMMLANGSSIEEISRITNLSINRIHELLSLEY